MLYLCLEMLSRKILLVVKTPFKICLLWEALHTYPYKARLNTSEALPAACVRSSASGRLPSEPL